MSRENEAYTEEEISSGPRDKDGDPLPEGAVDVRWAGYADFIEMIRSWKDE